MSKRLPRIRCPDLGVKLGQSYHPKVGGKVRIATPLCGRYNRGTVIRVEGAYIYVQLNYKGIEVERYPNELELL